MGKSLWGLSSAGNSLPSSSPSTSRSQERICSHKTHPNYQINSGSDGWLSAPGICGGHGPSPAQANSQRCLFLCSSFSPPLGEAAPGFFFRNNSQYLGSAKELWQIQARKIGAAGEMGHSLSGLPHSCPCSPRFKWIWDINHSETLGYSLEKPTHNQAPGGKEM